jgi:hypothetical protein
MSSLKTFIRGIAAASVTAVALSFAAAPASAATKDVDLMFVIDRSGSMGGEFNTLAANIESFFNELVSDSRTGSVAGGLVTYLATPSLEQAITTSVATLKSAVEGVTVSGGTENGLDALSSVLPGGSLFGSAGWRNNTVKSLILLTDEDDDGAENYADIGADIAAAGYLNNIIVSSGGNEYAPSAVPSGAVFSLSDFTNDPLNFFPAFAQAKLGEIETTPETPGGVIPLPASIPLLLTGLGAIGVLRARRKA